MEITFEHSLDYSSLIKVIGVGGGGSNAVNYMYKQGIPGVDFIVCNTDLQALEASPVENKIQLGANLTQGLGAGSIPEIGRNAAIEDIDKIQFVLENNTKMVFITAGMGGGTGTGAAPVIAAKAKDMGLLTVGIVTIPFSFEGKKRMQQAVDGIKELKKSVDTILIICNDKLRLLYGNLTLSQALAKADNVLNTAAKGIAEIITMVGGINVDLHDVQTVMKDSGVALMGTGIADGDDRAVKSVVMALESPLLNDNNIKGAKDILLYIRSGKKEITMDEITEITEYIQNEAGSSAQIIWGTGIDAALEENIAITLIATGFESKPNIGIDVLEDNSKRITKKVTVLDDDLKVTQTIEKPVVIAEPEQEIVSEQQTVINNDVLEVQSEVEAVSEEISEEITFETAEEKATTWVFEMPVASVIEEQPMVKIETRQIEVEVKEPKTEDDEMVLIKRSEVKQPETIDTSKTDFMQKEKVNERILRLKELSMKLRRPGCYTELEAEPAFKRRDVKLNDIIPSDESHVSRYTLTEDSTEGEKKNIDLRSNNPYLHDNVD